MLLQPCIFRGRKALGILLALVLLLTPLTGMTKTYGEETDTFSGVIWIAGDSIAADHSYENEANYAVFVHGWGEVLGQWFTPKARIENKAISGQSAKYFVQEKNYQDIMRNIGPGDLLLIQFGHNDYKSDGNNHHLLPTETEGSYKWYLKNHYVDPALQAGAYPVLCTSVTCCQFSDDWISENQPQNLFAQAMRELQQEYAAQGIVIGLIDAYHLTRSYLNGHAGEATSHYALKYDKGGSGSTSLDHVHFSKKGAEMTADILAENLFLLYPELNAYNASPLTEGGDGTPERPYLIRSLQQFYRILQQPEYNRKGVCFRLTQDLDQVVGVRDSSHVFYGNLDGDGHVIRNLSGGTSRAFLDVNEGEIKNLHLTYAVRESPASEEALFVRENHGLIQDCTASGTVQLDFFGQPDETRLQGVFADVNWGDGQLERCTSEVTLTCGTDRSQYLVGGIVGVNAGTILSCANNGRLLLDVTENGGHSPVLREQIRLAAAGIAGMNAEGGELRDCTSQLLPRLDCDLRGDDLRTERDPLSVPESRLYVRGDQNGDGQLTLSDVSALLRLALGIQPPAESILTNFLSDLDRDGALSLQDASLALRRALGIA